MLINILGGSVNTIKTGLFVVVNKETEQDVNADKNKYMIMSQNQNAGQNHNIYF
jgi:ribosomal protein L30E